MTQILIVLDDKELTTIFQRKLAQKYEVEVIVKSSSSEAISILEMLPGIEIFLCKGVIGKDPVASKVCDFLKAKADNDSQEVKVIVIGETPASYPKAISVGLNPNYQKLSEFIGYLLGKEEVNALLEDEKTEQHRAEEERLEDEREEKKIAEQEVFEKREIEKEKAEKKIAIQERIERGNARIAQQEKEKEKEKEEKIALRISEDKNSKIAKAESEKVILENKTREEIEKEKLRVKEQTASEQKAKEQAARDQTVKEQAFREKLKKSELEREQNNENDSEKTTVFQLPAQLRSPVAVEKEEKTGNLEYLSMNVIYFMNLPDITMDFSVYSRIKKQDGFEYNKKFSANSKFNQAEIERVLNRSGKDLYIVQDEAKRASAFLNGLFIERFKNPNLSWSDRMKLNSDSFEILLDLFKNSNFDKYNVEIIKELIKSIDLMVKSPEALSLFLTGLSEKKLSYGYSHSHLTFYFLMQVVDHFAWGKDQSKNKLLYLSLFHDLNLNSDRLIKLHHNYAQESKNLSEEEKKIMLGHADASANVLESIVKAPKELTSLIREHHGLKSGKGFIDSLSLAITPTSMAFLVTEDLVTQYLVALERVEGNKALGVAKPQLEFIFTELKKKYVRLTYGDVLGQLQKSLKIS
jgi:hypothetical protein